jgi:hypothetical protein
LIARKNVLPPGNGVVVAEGVRVSVALGVADGVRVSVALGVRDGVFVCVAVGVYVGVPGTGVCVWVAVSEGVDVLEGVAVAAGMPSTRHTSMPDRYEVPPVVTLSVPSLIVTRMGPSRVQLPALPGVQLALAWPSALTVNGCAFGSFQVCQA